MRSIVVRPQFYTDRDVGHRPFDFVDKLYDRLELRQTLLGGDAEHQNESVA